MKSGATSRGIWPQEIRFFPKDLSPLSPIVAKRLEFPAGQVPSWSSSYPGCGIYVSTGPGPILGRVGGKVYALKPRDLVLIPPGAPVCWFAEKSDASLLVVHFLPSVMMVDMNTRELAAFLSSFRFGRDEEVKVRSLPREAFQAITARLQTLLAEQGDAPGERGLKWKVLLGIFFCKPFRVDPTDASPGNPLGWIRPGNGCLRFWIISTRIAVRISTRRKF